MHRAQYRAPARVNLIGGQVDYHEGIVVSILLGWSLPNQAYAAIGERLAVAQLPAHRLRAQRLDLGRGALGARQRPHGPPVGYQALDQRTADEARAAGYEAGLAGHLRGDASGRRPREPGARPRRSRG